MATPREALFAAVADVLATMTGAPWGGAYPEPPRIGRERNPFILQNAHPFVALVPQSGSQITRHDHDGGDLDRVRFDLYGQTKVTPDATAYLWAERLRHDVVTTVTLATRPYGPLFMLGCLAVDFGPETMGYDDTYADVLIPCTASLTYVLAAMHA